MDSQDESSYDYGYGTDSYYNDNLYTQEDGIYGQNEYTEQTNNY